MTDKEITVIEFNLETDTALILREDGLEFMYPGRSTADDDDYVDPKIIPMVALALLYANWAKAEEEGEEIGITEETLLNILHGYVGVYIESECND